MEMKTVLITGAMGGLGVAMTEAFYKNGWHVIATDLSGETGNKSKQPEKVRDIIMDVSSGESVGEVAKQLSDEHLQLDLIINNAGIDRYFPLCETPPEQFR
jgi:acetoacetyl-CoA reductase